MVRLSWGRIMLSAALAYTRHWGAGGPSFPDPQHARHLVAQAYGGMDPAAMGKGSSTLLLRVTTSSTSNRHPSTVESKKHPEASALMKLYFQAHRQPLTNKAPTAHKRHQNTHQKHTYRGAHKYKHTHHYHNLAPKWGGALGPPWRAQQATGTGHTAPHGRRNGIALFLRPVPASPHIPPFRCFFVCWREIPSPHGALGMLVPGWKIQLPSGADALDVFDRDVVDGRDCRRKLVL